MSSQPPEVNRCRSFHARSPRPWWRLLSLLIVLAAASAPSRAMPFAQWAELQKGQAPDSVYQYENLDTVNLLNGNLTLTVPLGEDYPVSSSLSYGLTLVYNSNPWEALKDNRHECRTEALGSGGTEWIDFYPKTLDRLSNAGVGWMINLGRFEPPGWQYFDVLKPPFTYVAPDGSRHGLHPELHYQGASFSGVYHSRNGSFLRLIDHAACASTPAGGGPCRRLELPDGSYQEFHRVGADPEDFRPTLISDAFGNRVEISYSGHRWTITDQHQRSHRVDFDPSTPARSYTKVESVTLSAFGGRQATYSFVYAPPVAIDRHQYLETVQGDLACLGTRANGANGVLLEEQVADVEFLDRLILPDGSFYQMSYDVQDATGGLLGEKSGAINHLRLASGLHYRWTYSWAYGLPKPGSRRTPRPQERVAGVGLKQRYVLTPGGAEAEVVTWEYQPSRAFFNADGDPGNSEPLFRPCFQKTDVRFFAGDLDTEPGLAATRHSRHYFSTAINGRAGTGISFKSRQSLPFTACPPDGGGDYYTDAGPFYYDGLFLSQETLDPADPHGPPLRSVWVDYETDAPVAVEDKDGDRRLIRRRTVYHDDGGRWTEVRHADFDGLGNFRRTVRSSSFEGTDGPSTSFTAYNMSAAGGSPSGPDFTPGPSSRWLLGLYEEVCKHQGSGFGSCAGARQRTLYDYHPQSGFLKATRQLRGGAPSGTDILTVYSDSDGDGQPDSEKIYGGDPAFPGEPQLNPGQPFSPGGAPADHHAEHAYAYGVRSRSVIRDGAAEVLEVLDQTIDRHTGLVARSRDAAGLETILDFDAMARLSRIDVKKNGQFVNVASHIFQYTVPTEVEPDLTRPSVLQYCGTGNCLPVPLGFIFEARQCPPGTADYNACTETRLGERRNFYDRQGRLIDERRMVPWTAGEVDVGKEVFRKRGYDLADRLRWETKWHASGIGFHVFFTENRDFDAFDRPRTIRRPDLEELTLAYAGDRLTRRTVRVWTGSSATPSTTHEQRDGFGRLIRVTEPAGAGGTDVHTTYRYDQGDRLVSVCVGDGNADPLDACDGQRRTFTFDGSGLLSAESHPEIEGPAAFTYDARGNVLSKDLSGTAHDLTYRYDAAGRMVEIVDGDGYLFQELFYGTDNAGGRRVGKLYQARRHNWVPESAGSATEVDHVVTETFDYSAPGDRLASYTVRSSHGASWRTEYTYDAAGAVTRLRYPRCDRVPCADLAAGPTLDVETFLGRPIAISGWLNKVRYRADLELSRIEHANGLTDKFLRHLTEWTPLEKIVVEGGAGALWDTGVYEHDGAGNIYQIGPERFAYDRVSRLREATVDTAVGVASESLTYDVYGNIRTLSRSGEAAPRELSPSAATNRVGGGIASYDAGGNVVSWTEGNTAYGYSYAPDNRITALEGNSRARAFLYTASGERFAVLDQGTGVETYTPRDGDDGVLSRFERSATGDWRRAKDYVRVRSRVVGTLSEGVVRHLHHDHLGSTRLITDATGAVVGERTTHFPFGLYARDGTVNAEEHRFAGHERDDVGQADAALDYMHARYYAPAVGRFLSVDELLGDAARPQSWNRYAYARNNPVANVDPDGRFAFGILAKIARFAIKGGDLASTVAGAVDDFNTLTDSDASLGSRVFAGVSLASEVISPVSAKDAKRLGSAVSGVGDTIGGKVSDAAGTTLGRKGTREVRVPSNRYPETAAHIQDAQRSGHPEVLTIDRPGTRSRRHEARAGHQTVPGRDLDEYPPAMFREGGSGASIRPVNPSDNRGAGACIGNQCRGLPDGTRVKIVVEER